MNRVAESSRLDLSQIHYDIKSAGYEVRLDDSDKKKYLNELCRLAVVVTAVTAVTAVTVVITEPHKR